jgi:endonuclease G, mitochondrial
MARFTWLCWLLGFLPMVSPAQFLTDPERQAISAEIGATEQRIDELQRQVEAAQRLKEDLLLRRLRLDLHALGLPALAPGDTLIEHQAYSLVYSEAHEQAKWVAHIILPEVIEGNVARTNDFRPDPQLRSGSTVEADYFLKYEQPDGSYQYDGFGYDRGHLAPSADFRWSQTALSESYFYSNMSPQAPEFNRGRWAELEGMLRSYLQRSPQTQLYVVTGPVLHDSLPIIERSLNQVSIPDKYFKAVLDYQQQRGIAFLMPNHKLAYPVETYAVPIDSVEQVTGLDFFPQLPDALEEALESQREPHLWLPSRQQEDAEPILPRDLPKGTYNTVQARFFAENNERVTICGTVVDTKLTRGGHTFLNLDKKFPNHIFTLAIWKPNAVNFSYQPHGALLDQRVCAEGKLELSDGIPTMELRSEKEIWVMGQRR